MVALVELEVALNRLGIESDDPKADDVRRLINGISAEIRRRTQRGFEGDEGATYDEIYRLDPAATLSPPWQPWIGATGLWLGSEAVVTLRHAPVASVTSVRRVHFNGEQDAAVMDPTLWRLDDAELGILRVRSYAAYLRVISVVTGDIPDDVSQAALEWLETSWAAEPTARRLQSYSTGDDSETYDLAALGPPPAGANRVIAGYFRSIAGGPV